MMESSSPRPTPADAAAALHDAEASRDALARAAAPGRAFFACLGLVIATQIATTAVGLGADRPEVLVGGLVLFAVVGAAMLLRLRRVTGAWVSGFVSRVVLGTDARASAAYAVALGAAIWAALESHWWLVAACSTVGGLAYVVTGRRWMARYQSRPQDYVAAESPLVLGVLALAASAGMVLLILGG